MPSASAVGSNVGDAVGDGRAGVVAGRTGCVTAAGATRWAGVNASVGSGRVRRGRLENDHLEMWVGSTRDRIPLLGDGITIGQSPTNDVPLPFDLTVSHVHCALERVASRWCVRDLSSRNGTFVNGERIFG